MTIFFANHKFLDSGSAFHYISPLDAQIAQSVEQWTENPRVAGSIPALGTTLKSRG